MSVQLWFLNFWQMGMNLIKNLIDDVSKIDERTKKEDFDENHQAVDEVFNRELNIDLS